METVDAGTADSKIGSAGFILCTGAKSEKTQFIRLQK